MPHVRRMHEHDSPASPKLLVLVSTLKRNFISEYKRRVKHYTLRCLKTIPWLFQQSMSDLRPKLLKIHTFFAPLAPFGPTPIPALPLPLPKTTHHKRDTHEARQTMTWKPLCADEFETSPSPLANPRYFTITCARGVGNLIICLGGVWNLNFQRQVL